MQVRILRTLDELYALEPRWSRGRPPTPFCGPTFVLSWFEGHPDESPFVVAVTQGESLLALAPWSVVRTESGARRLSGAGGVESAYHDPWIFVPGRQAACERAIAMALWRSRRDFDLLDLTLQDGSGLSGRLRWLGLSFCDRIDWRQHALIEFGGPWESYWAERKEHFDGNLRRAKKLSKLPHRFLTADAATMEPMLDELFRMHGEHLGHVRDWRPYHGFVRRMARRGAERGELRLHALEIEGRLAALDLCLVSEDMVYGLMRAYHPDFSGLAAGFCLTLWEFEQFCRAGVRRIDCGCGRYEWKTRFQTGMLATRELQVATTFAGLRAFAWQRAGAQWLRRFPVLYGALRRLRTPDPSPTPAGAMSSQAI